MTHFVFLDTHERVLGVAVNTTPEKADVIAAHLTQKRIDDEGYIDRWATVQAREIEAYESAPVKVGDKVSGRVANTLPKGSAIVRVGGPHGTGHLFDGALLRGVVGYIRTDLTAGPVDEDARFEILHIGGTTH
jgi:hypothetical protein